MTQGVYPSVLAKPSWDTCLPDKPPTPDDLRNALTRFPLANDVKEAQVLLMTDAWMKQTQVVGECRQQLQSLQRWFDEQYALEY